MLFSYLLLSLANANKRKQWILCPRVHFLGYRSLVPRVGFEPTRRSYAARDFKSLASTIPPPRQVLLSYTLIFREARADWSQIIFSPSLENFRDPASRFGALAEHRCGFQFPPCDAYASLLRPGRELNPRIAVLQTAVLPLHHRASVLMILTFWRFA